MCTAALHGSNLMHTHQHQHFAVKIKGISGHYCLLACSWRVGRWGKNYLPPLNSNKILPDIFFVLLFNAGTRACTCAHTHTQRYGWVTIL